MTIQTPIKAGPNGVAPRYIYLVLVRDPGLRVLFRSYDKQEALERLEAYGRDATWTYCLNDRIEAHLDALRNPYQSKLTFADRVDLASRGMIRNDPDAWHDDHREARAAEGYIPAGGAA